MWSSAFHAFVLMVQSYNGAEVAMCRDSLPTQWDELIQCMFYNTFQLMLYTVYTMTRISYFF